MRRIRDDGIAIAVRPQRLHGDARPELFAQRPAPIQINMHWVPGTLGRRVVRLHPRRSLRRPAGAAAIFHRALSRHADTLLSRATRRARRPDRRRSRAGCGLPEGRSCSAASTTSYKILPQVFDAWMRILAAVPGSVLWLLGRMPTRGPNLLREAERGGIDPERLIFAPRVECGEHLARNAGADLFLDTRPTTRTPPPTTRCSSACRSLTCAGETMVEPRRRQPAARDRPAELVTIESRRLRGAGDRARTRPRATGRLRARLARNRATHPLFDMAALHPRLRGARSLPHGTITERASPATTS